MIEIKKDKNADSRSAGKDIDQDDLLNATYHHIADVRQGLLFFSEMLLNAGWAHDWTKIAYLEEFHETLTTLEPGEEVKKSKWYKMHIDKERHHLLSNAPDDITLIDVIEHLVDCVMAGLARTGELYDISLSDELLQKAHKNTIELLKSKIKVVEDTNESETP